MGLSIKRLETERKARAVAARLGVGITEAIDLALDRTWNELTAGEQAAERARRREVFFERVKRRGAGDGRSLAEIEARMYGDGGEPL